MSKSDLQLTAATGCVIAPLARQPLSAEAAIELAAQLKALSDPVRLRLFSLGRQSRRWGSLRLRHLRRLRRHPAHHLPPPEGAQATPGFSHPSAGRPGCTTPSSRRRCRNLSSVLSVSRRRRSRQELQHDRHHYSTRPRPSSSKLSALDRFLPVWIGIAMAAGLLLGRLDSRLEHSAEPRSGRRHLVAHRTRPADHDVSGSGQGPLRPTRHRHRRPEVAGQLVGTQLGARPGADVRAGLAAAARSARIPHGPDHRRTGALHRHGDHLERPRLRRPRSRRRARRIQLGFPGDHVRRTRLVLSLGATRLARAWNRPPSAPLRGRSPSPC